MAEYGQPECRLGDENVARHHLKRRTGRIGAALEVPRHHHPLAAIFHGNLCTAEHMAGGVKAEPHPAALKPRTIIARHCPRLRGPIAQRHDGQRGGGGINGAVPAAGMVGMAVGDRGMRARARRVDPHIGRDDVDAIGVRDDPAAVRHARLVLRRLRDRLTFAPHLPMLSQSRTVTRTHHAMPRSVDIAAQLPFLRRYARALTGNQSSGDRLVETALTAIVDDPSRLDTAPSLRLGVFAELQRAVTGLPSNDDAVEQNRIARVPPLQRQLLLLTALENFTTADAAEITGLSQAEAEREIAAAYAKLDSELRTSVLIIEDEPLIAMDLEHLVQDLGHRVTGLAATHSEAVAAVTRDRPGLVLADIQLADGSSGIDAVNEIQAAMDVPVIFITAFPERLLTGERVEPAFLITKPFRPAAVRATISQALMFETSVA